MKLTVNTIPNNSICFVGDSVISSYNVEDSPHVNTWIHRLANDPAYGYNGDVVSESYAGRIMATDMQTDTDIDNFAAKLASFNANIYWFEGGFNDYGFAHFANRTDLTLELFGNRMYKLLKKLRELKPTPKFYMSSIVPAFYEGPNLESVVDPLETPLIGTGPTADDYRFVQKLVANSIGNCEFVDFVTPSGGFSGIYGQTLVTSEDDLANGTTNRANIFYQYSPDGIHPNTAGQIKFCDAVKSRSRLLPGNTYTPFPLEIVTNTIVDFFQTNLTPFKTGEVYSHQLITINGLPSYTYNIVTKVGETLPAGITLSSSGLLSGTPTASNGTPFAFTVRSTESGPSPRSVEKTFTGFITETGGASPVAPSSSISYGTVVTSDLYDSEWTQEVIPTYSLVNKTSTVFNPTSNPSSGNAGIFCYFQSGPSASANSTGTLSFEAKGTGIMEVAIFNSMSLAKVWSQTFTLTSTLTTFTASVSLPKETEYRMGVFFSGDGVNILANNARDVEISKNFGLKFEGSNFYGLTGNYTRIRWDENSILGNGYTNWSGRKSYTNRFDTPAKKHLKHSSWAFMRLKNCNASKLIIEYVNSSDYSLPISVFENNSTLNSFITYQADNNQYYLVKRNESSLSSAGVSRTIEVVASNQSLQVNASSNYVDHMEFAVGAYIRAIYIEEGATFTLDTTPHPESVSFIGDSIINTGDPVTFINNPSAKLNWIHDIRRNGSATYNYPGDIFTDSSGARSLGQDLQDPTRRENLVQRLIKMGAKKIYIEGSTNDFFPTGNGRTYVTSSVFKANYKAFVDRILEVIPGCKVFIHVQFKFGSGYEAAVNSEGLTFSQWRQKVREIYTENYSSNPQVELVDFDTIWTISQAESTYLYNEGGQFIHPKYTAGQAKLAFELMNRSNIEVPLALSFSPGTLPNVVVNTPFSQAFTATNGTAPYTFSVVSGTLPAWLTLSGNTLSGTAPATVGSSSFSIRVTDNVGATFTKAFTLNVVASNMVLAPTTLTAAVRNVAYSQSLTVSGNVGTTLSFSATGLPTGLTINSSTGLISGTPAIGNSVGNYSLTISVSDGYNSQNFSRTLTLNGAALTVSPSTITNPQLTIPFSQVFTTSGGTAPYTYTVSGQPTGLTMSSGGTLSGTPSATGSFTFTVTSTDSVGNVGTRVITTTVQPAPPVVDYTVTINGSNQVIIGGTRTKPGGGLFSGPLDSYPSVYWRDGAGPLTYMTGGNVTWAGTSSTATTTLNATLAPGGLSHVPGRTYYLQGHIFAPTSIDGVAITAADPDINTP